MKKLLALVIVILLAGGMFFWFFNDKKKGQEIFPADQQNLFKNNDSINIENQMKISSPVFENDASIPAKYACDGDNVNPPLDFFDVPEQAASLALDF